MNGSPAEFDGCSLRRAEPHEHRAALGLLLTGSWGGPIQAFERFVRQASLALDELWIAESPPGQPAAAALVLMHPGRTAMLLLPHARRRRQERAIAALAAVVPTRLDPRRVRILQALLDPGQTTEREALRRGGFSDLARLAYMQASTQAPRGVDDDPDAGDPPPPLGLGFSRWSAQARPLFADAIQASYVETRDCPGLLGLRRIDDILAGHMASGRFSPETWGVLHRGDDPAGLVLLNQVVGQSAMELVYLGVAAGWRGRGLGRWLVGRAMAWAWRSGAARVLLAVDEENEPAIQLYRTLGFTAQDHKRAMIRVIDLGKDTVAEPSSFSEN